MRLCDVQLRVESGDGIAGHRGTAVGMYRFWHDAVIGRDGVLDEFSCEQPRLRGPYFPVNVGVQARALGSSQGRAFGTPAPGLSPATAQGRELAERDGVN
jgi:hypothetical protein